eukprot:gnl/MRDRNA2_/MRDRNA2_85541_c2_seq6.p1 gnl/MRDRNA2_/MRDRNA2_85541_c2~~gnl/MRDRNA2_/MRDRNA2_85541_c2_seq6.p1  ORF type:complete len:175 (+),score=34.87 gnl/MRDRNA2_/MRDRNA2_85541_c2_seq6:55-579(+)
MNARALIEMMLHTVQVVEKGKLSAGELAKLASAAAKSGRSKSLGELFEALGHAASNAGDFNVQEIISTVRAFTTACRSDMAMFQVLERSAEVHVREFDTQSLVRTVWTFAKADWSGMRLYDTLATRIEGCLDEFNARDLAKITWAFASVYVLNVPLLGALERAATSCLFDFSPR